MQKLRAELEEDIPVPSYEKVRSQFESVKQMLESPLEPEELKYIVDRVIKKVVVYPNCIVIVELK